MYMYEFWYDYLKEKYDKIQLIYTDRFICNRS